MRAFVAKRPLARPSGVVMLLIDSHRRIWLGQGECRLDGQVHGKYLMPPCDLVGDGETAAAAAVRVLQDATGLQVASSRLNKVAQVVLALPPSQTAEIAVFAHQHTGGTDPEPVEDGGLSGAGWYTLDAIDRTHLAPYLSSCLHDCMTQRHCDGVASYAFQLPAAEVALA